MDLHLEINEFQSFVETYLKELEDIKFPKSALSTENYIITNVASEGLASWCKNKLVILWGKFKSLMTKVLNRLRKRRLPIEAAITRCKSEGNRKRKTNVSLATLKFVSKAAAMTAVGITHILACAIDPKGNIGISDITQALCTKLNMTIFKINQDFAKGPWYTENGDILTAAKVSIKGMDAIEYTLRNTKGKIIRMGDKAGDRVDIHFKNIAKATHACAEITRRTNKIYVAKVWK